MRTAMAYGAGQVRGTRLPLVGRGDCAQLSPECWPGPVLRPVACGRRAVQGDGDHRGWPSRTPGVAGPPGCTTNGHREGETAKMALMSAPPASAAKAAVEVGFEATEDLRLHTLSRTAHHRSPPAASVLTWVGATGDRQ